MKSRLIVFGAYALNWSHNKQLLELLNNSFDVKKVLIENRGKLGLIGLISYLIKNLKYVKNLEKKSICFVGFNSFYDVILLKTGSFLFKKDLKIINESLVLQYDTYIINKPITRIGVLLNYYKFFLYYLDYFTLKFSHKIIFDTNANFDRFTKEFNVEREKCYVVPLCANNSIFRNNKDKKFFYSKKVNIIWYGNPSKLHNLEFIKDVFSSLDKDKFECEILTDMKKISLEEIAEKLDDVHISFGCFGDTDKCTNVVINKEYEAFANGCLLITKRGNKEELCNDSNTVFMDNKEEIIDFLEDIYINREKFIEYFDKINKTYKEICSNERLSNMYGNIINE